MAQAKWGLRSGKDVLMEFWLRLNVLMLDTRINKLFQALDWWFQDFPKRLIHMLILKRHPLEDCGYCNLHVCG